jgi:hypothetical protein
VPALVQCTPPTLYKGAPWYEIPAEPFFIRIAVRENLEPAALANLGQPPAGAARELTRALESHFSKELRTL